MIVPETRGRKRNTKITTKVARLAKKYEDGEMPVRFHLTKADVAKEIKRFRSSTDFRELQKKTGEPFSFFPFLDGFVVTCRKADK